jgi:hypothetical protein
MYGSDLGNKLGLLRACISSDLIYINDYGFGPHGIQSWLGLIKMLVFFSYKDWQNIIIKLKGKFIHYYHKIDANTEKT